MRDRLLAELPRADEPGVRWIPPEQWHVTLRFLGEVDEELAVPALKTLDAPGVTATLGPRVSRLGRSVVCLPVAGLEALAHAVATATGGVGEPEERRFNGHVTLARLRNRAACGVAGTAFAASFSVEQVELVRSALAADGAWHDVVDTVALRR